ncbi:MAG: hypothetical protein M3680_12845 [Myxococcota bacterium]|nr:hypothetical protein [Myxococcota bacterium]
MDLAITAQRNEPGDLEEASTFAERAVRTKPDLAMPLTIKLSVAAARRRWAVAVAALDSLSKTSASFSQRTSCGPFRRSLHSSRRPSQPGGNSSSPAAAAHDAAHDHRSLASLVRAQNVSWFSPWRKCSSNGRGGLAAKVLGRAARLRRKLRAARHGAICEPDNAARGPRRIAGMVVAIGDPLIAPLSGRACVFHETRVVRVVGLGLDPWDLDYEVAVEKRGVPFLIDDGTGRALITSADAERLLETDVDRWSSERDGGRRRRCFPREVRPAPARAAVREAPAFHRVHHRGRRTDRGGGATGAGPRAGSGS